MKDMLRQTIGKTISEVVVKEGRSPRAQVFLVFADDTYCEIYSSTGRIEGGHNVYPGGADAARRYGSPPQEVVADIR